MEEMQDKELLMILIDQYANLQRIKKANGDTVNEELDYQIRATAAKRNSVGMNLEELTL